MLAALEKFVPLAPLHQPHNLAPIRSLLERCAGAAAGRLLRHRVPPPRSRRSRRRSRCQRRSPSAACGATAFTGCRTSTSPACCREFDERAAARQDRRAASGQRREHVRDRRRARSVASTMGFTAADGLPMGTRCGSLDPGVMLYLMDELRMDARAIEKLIYQQSGLLGVSGISSDMRTLRGKRRAAREGRDRCIRLPHRPRTGSLAAALGGLDAIVFTAGIGENSRGLRERVCHDAGWLGVELDAAANTAGGPRISTAGSRISAWVDPDQRRADDRPAHAAPARSTLSSIRGQAFGPSRHAPRVVPIATFEETPFTWLSWALLPGA